MANSSELRAEAWAGCGPALRDLALFVVASGLKAHRLTGEMNLATASGDLANLLLLLGVGWLVMGFPVKIRRGVLLLWSVALSGLLLADGIHHRAFGDVISAPEFGHAAQLSEMLAGVLPYLHWRDLLFALDFPVWIWFLVRRRPAPRAKPRAVIWISGALVSLGAWGLVLHEFVIGMSLNGDSMVSNRPFTVREKGVLTYHVLDAVEAVRVPPERRTVQVQDLARVKQWFQTNQVAGRELLPFGVARGYNALFIQVESLEAFVIGLRVDGQEITPHLNRVAREHFHFSRFFPQTSLGSTSDAEFCALNSLLPAGKNVVARRYAENQFHGLPIMLRDHGYRTLAMSVCRPKLWNMAWMHRAYGLERRFYYDDFAVGPEHPLMIPDDRFLMRCRELLREQARPFFAHVMTISSHTPFTWIRPEHRKLRLGALEGTTLADYLQSVHFVDAAIGQFLEGLKADGLDKQTAIFIYGDHHALPMEERERIRTLEPDLIGLRLDEHLRRRVPLLVIIPGVQPGGTVERVAGQIDLTPTALHLLGIGASEGRFLGQNLFRESPPLVCFRSGSFATAQEMFTTPDGMFEQGRCEPIVPGTLADAGVCARFYREVQERIWISDTILEQNMIPALLKNDPKPFEEPAPGLPAKR